MIGPRQLLSLPCWSDWVQHDPLRAVVAGVTVLVWITAVRLVIATALALASCSMPTPRSRQRMSRRATQVVPRWARPMVLAVVAVPVLAQSPIAQASALTAQLPSLDRAYAPLVSPGEAVTVTSTPAAAADAGNHLVRPGESLWSIAAEELGPQASAAAIAQRWPQWWHTNAAQLGDQPQLLHPGQHLLTPTDTKDA